MAIKRSQMKDISPKKYTNMQVSGNFRSWAKHVKHYLFQHDTSIRDLIEYFDNTWIMDQKFLYKEIGQCCANTKLDSEADSALHMVIKALEGEMLANTAEANNPQNLEVHTSAPELWGLLKHNSDRASAFNVVSILESIRNINEAKNIQDVISKHRVSKGDIKNTADKQWGEKSRSS